MQRCNSVGNERARSAQPAACVGRAHTHSRRACVRLPEWPALIVASRIFAYISRAGASRTRTRTHALACARLGRTHTQTGRQLYRFARRRAALHCAGERAPEVRERPATRAPDVRRSLLAGSAGPSAPRPERLACEPDARAGGGARAPASGRTPAHTGAPYRFQAFP